MRSKIVVMMSLCLIVLSSSCFAMTFSQPIKLGEYFQTQVKGAGFVIKGATYNKGDYYTKFDNNNKATYGKGVACFGNGDDALYLHYNAYNTALYDPHTHGTIGNGDTARLGSKNIQDTLPFSVGVRFTRISKITGDNGYTFYRLSTGYDIAEDGDETLIGRLPDGKFVKYFDTEDISKRYFGSHWGVCYKKVAVRGDTITIYYDRTISSSSFNTTKVEESGEFRFKWDDAAQWFGIEQVVYR